MMLMVMLFVMCVLWGHVNNSGDLYYTADTAQFDYVTVDEVSETVAANWRGLQEKDVSFKMVALYLSKWLQFNFLIYECNSGTFRTDRDNTSRFI
jgi:hypothetical protein